MLPITNALLQRVDVPGTASASGDVSYATGPALALLCAFDNVTHSQRFLLGVVGDEATGVLYLALEDVVAGLAPRARVTVLLDDALNGPATYQVIYVKERAGSHVEVFVKAL